VRACFLTLAWGGPPGARPAWLFTSADDKGAGRGVGKSAVAKVAARLVGGHIDLAANERMPDVITRLLTPDALERRVVLLDNVKSLKLSWGELEALIRNDSVSGHRLYHGESRRPNTLTYCLTLNGAALSRDMAQRCVIVKLARPQYGPTWEEDTYAARRSGAPAQRRVRRAGHARGPAAGVDCPGDAGPRPGQVAPAAPPARGDDRGPVRCPTHWRNRR